MEQGLAFHRYGHLKKRKQQEELGWFKCNNLSRKAILRFQSLTAGVNWHGDCKHSGATTTQPQCLPGKAVTILWNCFEISRSITIQNLLPKSKVSADGTLLQNAAITFSVQFTPPGRAPELSALSQGILRS